MKLIVGLGNPGLIYKNSRHNIGFSVVKTLSRAHGIPLKKAGRINALSGAGRLGAQRVILGLPLAFMNLSGAPVEGLLKKFAVGVDNLLVVCDDLDLEFGRLRIRPGGSSGGHRGLESVINVLGTRDFARLRVGIGRPPHQLKSKNIYEVNWCEGRPPHKAVEAAQYVLSGFNRRERGRLAGIVGEAVACCACWAQKGITESMNTFNKKG